MYERSYGYRYDEPAKNETTVDIAKRIRADIKQAVSEGLLPARWTYSVRSPHGTSIDVEVRDCLDAWQPCDGTKPGSRRTFPDGSSVATACPNVWCAARNDPERAHAAKPHDVLTEEAQVAKMTLERIHGAYNHDGSELQTDYFDVRYYGHVEFEDADSHAWRAKDKAEMAAKKNARERGTPNGLYVNYSRDGRQTVHVTVETPEGKTVLGCGARVWRGGLGGRASFGYAAVTCSRCAKRYPEAR